jgi:hypothetical protein
MAWFSPASADVASPQEPAIIRKVPDFVALRARLLVT